MGIIRNRDIITDAMWERLQPFLPAQKPATGRPAIDHRLIINGILWIIRTGAPWRDLPERYGNWSTVASRFYRWCTSGIWDAIFEAIVEQADADGIVDWNIHYVDSTVVRAHQHAAGAEGSAPEAEALGRSRGGFGTKAHVRVEGGGRPMTVLLTPGQQHDTTVFKDVMESGSVKRKGRGRPKSRPLRVVADKGYTGTENRQYLRRRGIRYTIPHRSNERHKGPFDRKMYRKRNIVERFINRVKQFRRIATRYEKNVVYHEMIWTIAFIILWLKA